MPVISAVPLSRGYPVTMMGSVMLVTCDKDRPEAPCGSGDEEAVDGCTVEEERPRAREEDLEGELADAQETILRLRADFDNYRRRMRRQQEQIRSDAQAEMVRVFLPVIDNLERVLDAADEDDPVSRGVDMILRQIEQQLETAGVMRITAAGEEFDPHRHEAVAHLPVDDHPEGMVIEELQSGYQVNGRLVRPARVIVAQASKDHGDVDEAEAKKEEE